MKNKILITVIISFAVLIFTGFNHSHVIPANAVNIILDTDVEPDIGDVGALATINAYMDNGKCNILGVICCGSYPNAPYAVDAIMTYYGHPQVAIATNGGPFIEPLPPGSYAANLRTNFNYPKSKTNYEEAVSCYRRLLSSQDDGSVIITSIGFFSTLDQLLKSPPDSWSSLSGTNLIAKKVKKVCSAAGDNPTGYEYNIYSDIPSAQHFIANCPVPIEFTAYSAGLPITTGPGILSTVPITSPVRGAWNSWLVDTGQASRPCWDQLGVIHSVENTNGVPTIYFGRTSKGINAVNNGGTNIFSINSSGNNYYMTNIMSNAGFSNVVNNLEIQPPIGGFW